MTKWQFALIVVFGLLIAVAVGLLIAAPCLGHSNIIEMFRSWFASKPETPPVEDVTEVTSLFVNLLRF